MPHSRKEAGGSLRLTSQPLTESPRSFRIAASPLIPIPPTPMKWIWWPLSSSGLIPPPAGRPEAVPPWRDVSPSAVVDPLHGETQQVVGSCDCLNQGVQPRGRIGLGERAHLGRHHLTKPVIRRDPAQQAE